MKQAVVFSVVCAVLCGAVVGDFADPTDEEALTFVKWVAVMGPSLKQCVSVPNGSPDVFSENVMQQGAAFASWLGGNIYHGTSRSDWVGGNINEAAFFGTTPVYPAMHVRSGIISRVVVRLGRFGIPLALLCIPRSYVNIHSERRRHPMFCTCTNWPCSVFMGTLWKKTKTRL